MGFERTRPRAVYGSGQCRYRAVAEPALVNFAEHAKIEAHDLTFYTFGGAAV